MERVRLDQQSRIDLQGLGKRADGADRAFFFPGFDFGEVRTGQAGHVGEVVLGHAAVPAQDFDGMLLFCEKGVKNILRQVINPQRIAVHHAVFVQGNEDVWFALNVEEIMFHVISLKE